MDDDDSFIVLPTGNATEPLRRALAEGSTVARLNEALRRHYAEHPEQVEADVDAFLEGYAA